MELQALRHQYHAVTVSRLIEETADARTLILDIPDTLKQVFTYRAGQFVTLEIPIDGKAIRRCYSLASALEWESEYKVTVKRVPNGVGSTWLVEQLKEGDTLRVLPPEGRFVLTQSKEPLMLFAAGSGITPIISLLKSALKGTNRSVHLIYANQNEGSVIYRAELEAIAAAYPSRLKLELRFDDKQGYLTSTQVEDYVDLTTLTEYYICGPDAFMSVVEEGLLEMAVIPGNIHVERFFSLSDTVKPPPAELSADDGGVKTVTVHFQGQRHVVPYSPKQTLLQACQKAKLDVPYSCEEGICGACAARRVSGTVRMDNDFLLTEQEKARGFVLPCTSYALTDDVELEFPDV